MGPLLVVGDVQGCYDELCDLLAAAGFDPARHRLAFVGDLINRGPRSRAVLELVERLGAICVVGNHEDGLLEARPSETLERVRRELGAELPRWLAFLARLPTFVRLPGAILVHAGIAPGKTPETSTRAELTRLRDVDGIPWFDAWRGPETVLFGHWAQRGKVDRPLAKGLDTGCVYGRELTALWWPRCEWISVPARRMWFDPVAHQPTW